MKRLLFLAVVVLFGWLIYSECAELSKTEPPSVDIIVELAHINADLIEIENDVTGTYIPGRKISVDYYASLSQAALDEETKALIADMGLRVDRISKGLGN